MVAGIALLGTGTQTVGRGHNRRTRLPLVGTPVEWTSYLHGRRNTGDCRSVKLGLHIDIAKLQIAEIRGIANSRRFCSP